MCAAPARATPPATLPPQPPIDLCCSALLLLFSLPHSFPRRRRLCRHRRRRLLNVDGFAFSPSGFSLNGRSVNGGALLSVPQAFNKNNLMLEERNKYFNPQLAGKTYTNAYFTDLNTYDDY